MSRKISDKEIIGKQVIDTSGKVVGVVESIVITEKAAQGVELVIKKIVKIGPRTKETKINIPFSYVLQVGDVILLNRSVD
ncbi:MAG: hypothetical protein DRJ52_04650 [Thermoprotei archaeon]|nr:MAG: hypothetical protein DRJ52_04650 [Thermoprotei archaeon]RLF00739.1 MAG: hypothetical protein DRJ63_01695 [Thermoprotei archaeon]